MNVQWVPVNSIRPADWRTTHMLRPDLKVLTESMVSHGWLSHLLVRREDSRIIDGYHRWLVASTDKAFAKAHDARLVPVVFLDVDEIDARVIHVQMNRARGAVVARYLSLAAKDIIRSRKYDEQRMRTLFNMSLDEIELLLDGSFIKSRNISEYQYSKAWVPVEAPANAHDDVVLERPPNADR